MSNLVAINQTLDSVDLKQLSIYTRKLMDIGSDFNKMLSANYSRDFIIAYDISCVMFSKVLQAELQAKSAVEEAEAIAYLDKANDFFVTRGEKPTVESKKAFVCLDSDVKAAKDTLARATATSSLLKSKVIEFREAISLIKALQSDGYTSAWEGISRN